MTKNEIISIKEIYEEYNKAKDILYIDVWAGDIGYFIGHANSYPQFAVSPKFMKFIVGNNQVQRVKN